MIFAAFDIGNVLCFFNIYRFTQKLSAITGISDDNAYFVLEHIQNMQDIGVTKVSHALKYRFPSMQQAELEELMACWNSTVTPSDMMMNFLGTLRHEGVKIALLSNMGPEHLSHLRGAVPEMFENAVQHISCEVGARKPCKLYYQSFCMDHNDFSGSVYIDDVEDNLRAGKKYGFKVYNFNLDEISKLSASKQKTELDGLKRLIYNK